MAGGLLGPCVALEDWRSAFTEAPTRSRPWINFGPVRVSPLERVIASLGRHGTDNRGARPAAKRLQGLNGRAGRLGGYGSPLGCSYIGGCTRCRPGTNGQARGAIGDAAYDTYSEHFDPDLFDPEVWRPCRPGGHEVCVITTSTMKAFACGTRPSPTTRPPGPPRGVTCCAYHRGLPGRSGCA